jgi:hypothetical protein
MGNVYAETVCTENAFTVKMPRQKTLLWKIVRHLAAIVALVLLGGLLSATLVRMAPGFDADERELDPSRYFSCPRPTRAKSLA